MFVFTLGTEIYTLDLSNQPTFIGYGVGPVWLTDGRTIIYQSLDGKIISVELDTKVADLPVGGYQSAYYYYNQTKYLLLEGGN
jgi:hypothetical protein